MTDHDLDIENYDLEDILNLFHCSFNFTESDLKKARKRSLMIHPDKSKLPIKYFLFYKKAYQTLEQVYRFRQKKFQCAHNVAYNPEIGDNNIELLRGLHGMKITEFNDWFNKAFNKIKIKDDNVDGGYGEWIQSEEGTNEDKPVNLSEFASVFEKKKKACKALVVHREISNITQTVGTTLVRDKVENYASDIFSRLEYEDLKKAHTETVVPVTHQDFLDKPKFNNVESLRRQRESQDVGPQSLQQAKRFLAKRESASNKLNSNQAFRLMKQDEEITRVNEKWWSNLKQLENR